LEIRARPAARAGRRPRPEPGTLAEARPGCHIGSMESFADRRRAEERRGPEDRRRVVVHVPVEQRGGAERRGGVERRGSQSVDELIRSALELLTNVAESGSLDEESLRDVDTAVFRLRFALDRFERRR
jgi:hypothetical protein